MKSSSHASYRAAGALGSSDQEDEVCACQAADARRCLEETVAQLDYAGMEIAADEECSCACHRRYTMLRVTVSGTRGAGKSALALLIVGLLETLGLPTYLEDDDTPSNPVSNHLPGSLEAVKERLRKEGSQVLVVTRSVVDSPVLQKTHEAGGGTMTGRHYTPAPQEDDRRATPNE